MFSGYSKSFRDNRDNLLQAAKSTYNVFNMTNNVRLAYFLSQTNITFVILKSLLDHIEGLMKI